VTAGFFFEVPAVRPDVADRSRATASGHDADALALAKAFARIQCPALRRQIVGLAEAMAAGAASSP
jgi:hypothetical protein